LDAGSKGGCKNQQILQRNLAGDSIHASTHRKVEGRAHTFQKDNSFENFIKFLDRETKIL